MRVISPRVLGAIAMDDKIKALIDKIKGLESELEDGLEGYRREFHYTVREKRVEFEAAVRQHHREMRTGILRYIRNSSLVSILLAPIFYALIVPLLLLDVAVTLFQAIAFPIYRIKKVPRDDFIVMDRHHLSYLNGIEKLNCAFCGYANGLLAYAREIAGRTEVYWCPIKHARKTSGQHRRYLNFAEFGDAEAYRKDNSQT